MIRKQLSMSILPIGKQPPVLVGWIGEGQIGVPTQMRRRSRLRSPKEQAKRSGTTGTRSYKS